METLPLRLHPGEDLRAALEQAVAARGCAAAFVLSGIGSLSQACVRFAGVADVEIVQGDLEIVSLAGTIAANGSHLHIAVADAGGQVRAGHAAPGCIVRTTAELLLALLPEWEFSREMDAATGHAELVVRERRERESP
jgi:predicted DNA-binding protein with PD1-like motif